MTNYLKKLLALAVAAGAMTAMAEAPIAVWSGDFATEQAGFTLDLNGNTAENGAITIGSNGVKIKWTGETNPFGGDQNATKIQVVVKYSNFLVPTEADKGTVMVSLTNGKDSATDFIGSCITQGGISRGVWSNNTIYSYNNNWPNKGDESLVVENNNDVHTYVTSYTRNTTAVPGTNKTFEGVLGFLDGQIAYGTGALKANYVVGDIMIGGKAGTGSNFQNATGMKIYGIAIFNTLEDPATIVSDAFPPTPYKATSFNSSGTTVVASTKLGGDAIGFAASGTDWTGSPTYEAVRGSSTDKAVVIGANTKPYNNNSDIGDGDFSVLTVAKIASPTDTPRAIAYVGSSASGTQGKGLALVTIGTSVKLVYHTAGSAAQVLITAEAIENVNTQYHSYLITYVAQKAQLYVDGQPIAAEPVAVPEDIGRNGLQLGGAYGGTNYITIDRTACSVGTGIGVDEFAIWREDVGAHAQTIAKLYPAWPNRHELDKSDATSPVKVSEINAFYNNDGWDVLLTLPAGGTLEVDELFNGSYLYLISEGSVELEGDILTNPTWFNKLNCAWVEKGARVTIDAITIPTTLAAPGVGFIYRFVGTEPLSELPFGTTRVDGTIEIARPVVSTAVLEVSQIKENYVFDADFTGTRLVTGNNNGARENITQLSGTITLTTAFDGDPRTATGNPITPILFGHYPNAKTTYNLLGGTLDASLGTLSFGRDSGVEMTIGGGATTATLKTLGVSYNGRTNESTLTVKENGVLELGKWGVYFLENKSLILAGGTVRAIDDNSIVSKSTPITLTDDTTTTIEVVAGKTSVIDATITGSGAIIKTGAGTLDVGTSRPRMDVREGKVRATVTLEEMVAGKLVLKVPENASQGDVNKIELVDENGVAVTVTEVTVDPAAHTVTLRLDALPAIRGATTISALNLSPTQTGIIGVIGAATCEEAYDITFDTALPAGISLAITGHVNLVGSGVTTFPAAQILLDEGACVQIDKPLSNAFTVGANRTLIFKDTTIDKVITIADNATVAIRGNVTGTVDGRLATGTTTRKIRVDKGATLTIERTEFWDYQLYLENHGTINIGGTTQQIKSESNMGLYYLYSGSVLTGTDAGRIRQGGAAEPRVRILADETASVPYATFDAVWGNNGWEKEVTFEIAEGAGLKYTKAQGSGDKFVEGANIAYLETTVATLRLRDGAVLTGPVMTSGTGAITLLGNNAFGEGVNLHLPATINAGSTTHTFNGTITVESGDAEAPAFITDDAVIKKMGSGTLVMGTKRPAMDLAEGKVRITATGAEIEAGQLELKVVPDATERTDDPAEVVSGSGESIKIIRYDIDAERNVIILTLETTSVRQSMTVSEIVQMVGDEGGAVAVVGSDECLTKDESGAVVITFDREVPANVSLTISRHVCFVTSGSVTTIPADKFTLSEGACVRLYNPLSVNSYQIPANATLITAYESTAAMAFTNNGTLKSEKNIAYTLTSAATATNVVVAGEATVTASAAQAIKGTVTIEKGATFINGRDDAISYGTPGTTVNVHGTLLMGATRWTVGGQSQINLYGDASITGEGSGDNYGAGVIDIFRDGNMINVFKSTEPGFETEALTATIAGVVRVRNTDGGIWIAQGASLALPSGLSGIVANAKVTLRRGDGHTTGHFAGAIPLNGTVTVDLGANIGTVPTRFIAKTGANAKLAWTNYSPEAPISVTDTKENPFILIEADATLAIDGHNYSGHSGTITDHGWIVNNGTLVFQDGDGQRFFRDHLVLKGGSTVKINSGDSKLRLFGGEGNEESSQLMLESGIATIVKGEGGDNGAIQIESSGASAFVGSNAKLSITAPISGDGVLTKLGLGTLAVGTSRPKVDVFGGVLELTATFDEQRAQYLTLPAPSATYEPDSNKYKVVNAGGERIDVTSVTSDGTTVTVSFNARLGRPLTDFVDITASATSSLTDFPVLVRISEEKIPGFTYERAGSDGSQIRFYQLKAAAEYDTADAERDVSNDVELPFEIVDWNPTGESLVWVKINSEAIESAAKGKFRMYWHATGELNEPLSKKEVWSAYTGVWHMDEDITATTAATAKSKDSTVNGIDAIPAKGTATAANLSQMVSVKGIVGNARVNSSSSPITGGNRLATNRPLSEVDGDQLFSAWYKMMNVGGYQRLVGSKTGNAGNGWSLETQQNSSDQFILRLTGGGGQMYTIRNTFPSLLDNWVHMSVLLQGRDVKIFANGTQVYTVTHNDKPASANTETPWAFGCSGDGSEWSFSGVYDELRIKTGTTSAEWAQAEYETVANPNFCTFGFVNRPVADDPNDRAWIDYWTVEPQLKHYWGVGQLTESVVSAAHGELKSGRAIAYTVKTIAGEAATLPLGTLGLYTVTYAPTVTTGPQGAAWAIIDGNRVIEVEVVESSADPAIDPAGPTFSGRVLTANDDARGGDSKTAIEAQNYDSPYWTHDEFETTVEGVSLKSGLNHTLTNASGRVLWTIKDGYLGNLLTPGETTAISNRYNTLPWSVTATENNQIILRNESGGLITSGMYEKGIGTIYFDAVNAWTNAPARGISLLVQVSESETDDDWRTIDVTPVKIEGATLNGNGATVTAGTPTNRVDCLSIDNSSISTFSFYRCYATVNVKKPIRFRIRREGFITSENGNGPDNADGFVLIDNVIASYAPDVPELVPAGKYDRDRTGTTVLGVETAFDGVAYPKVGDTVRAHVYVTSGDPASITSLRLRYRWRYLNALFDPARTLEGKDQWNTAFFNTSTAADHEFFTGDLSLPNRVGDLEYYYDFTATVPYYDYVDYATATGVAADSLAGYTEEPARDHPLEMRAEAMRKPSGGKDWFVRLREWASETRGYRLIAKKSAEATAVTNIVDFAFVGEGTWRAMLKTNESAGFGRGDVFYRIEREVPMNPGARAEELTFTTTYHRGNVSPNSAPKSMSLEEGSINDWASIGNDDSTGYLMFLLDERVNSITITRADYQNFNGWNDAHSDDAKFVASSTSSDGRSGVSSKQRAYAEDFKRWADCYETDTLWQENFNEVSVPAIGTYFNEASTRGTDRGWKAENGSWVGEGASGTGSAFRMAGNGAGRITCANFDREPRGLERFTYKARLADEIDFTKVAWVYDYLTLNTDATFITKVVMSDTNPSEAMKFDGEGTFALYASYMPGQGAYEFRVIRTGNTSIRYELSRIGYVNGELVRDVKVSRSFNGNADLFRKWNNQRPTAFISLDRVDEPGFEGSLKITAGFSRSHSITENMPLETDQFAIETFWDSDPIQFGSFGVAAANCPAVFDHPCVMDGHVKWITSKGINQTDGADSWTLGENFFPQQALNNDLRSTIEDKRWSIDQGRVKTFVDETVNPVRWGIKMSPLEQNIIFEYKAPTVKGQPEPVWTGLATNVVSSYVLADYEAVLRRAESGSYRIKHGGFVGKPRVDITIDDIKLYQWAGAEFGDFDTTGYARGDSARGYPTNFVFTSGWVKNNMVELSAKRTEPGKPCSLRTPLMDGQNGRGLGLGMMSVGYRNAATNLVMHFQVATNNVSSSIRNETSSLDPAIWTTVKTIDFSTMSADERDSGIASVYLGCHGVAGVARVLVEPSLSTAAIASDDPKFGSIEIVSVFCRDEPVLDDASWWGWNIRTFGSDELTRWDNGSRSFLPDYATEEHPEATGLSLALNNSVTVDIRDELEAPTYKVHMPFVQSPTFTSGRVGSVSFRARMFGGEDEQKAEIRLYGTTSTDLQSPLSAWTELAHFVVSNAVYETYTYRVPAESDAYNAFRFGVTGVPMINGSESGPAPTETESEEPLPVRVMMDEIVVSQAVYPKIGFRYVYPVRTGLETNEISPAIIESTGIANFREQPLVGENWTVQAEIMAKQLPEEIDLTVQPEVTFHWYNGAVTRWGYESWKDLDAAKSAKLELAEGEGNTTIYRGSLTMAPDAVVDEEERRRVIQYTVSVRYKDKSGEWQRQFLEYGEWVKPYWYDPIDYNRGEGEPFSAFTMLDTISPRGAWINEVNLFDGRNGTEWPGRKNQYVEIAVPAEESQTLDGWTLEYMTSSATNTLCTFGMNGIPVTKDVNVTNDYAFIALQSPNAAEANASAETRIWPEGTFDGTWSSAVSELDDRKPIALRLIRPSGVVEQEIVCVGTNYWGSSQFADTYKPENFANRLNAEANGRGHYYYVGNEDDNATITGELGRSLGVTNGTGAVAADWTNTMHQTPGKCNEGQVIPEDWLIRPEGSKIVVIARLNDAHLAQTFGDAVKSRDTVKITIPKGGEGTNLTYHVDAWFEMASVTENGVPLADIAGRQGEFALTVAKGAMKRVELIAATKPRADLTTTYGLNANNRYTDAVIDWLAKGTTLRGEFANPGTIALAEYYDLAGVKQGDLSLTDMYWLDIDPTVGARLDAGITAVTPVAKPAPQPRMKLAIGPTDQEASATTTDQNLRIKVKMVLSDGTDAWSPYILRGAAVGETSENSTNWSSATFKIKGALQNQPVTGLTPQWLPLRWFVFDANSFDENHEANIEVWDPFDTDRNTLLKGWEAFRGQYPIFYKWAIDEQNVPATPETLKSSSLFSAE